jgi:hypothetical protein
MSIADATLIIEHSSAECEADYVKSKFDQIFGPEFVVDVLEEVITAGAKKFYLIVDEDHPALMRITDLIHDNTFAAIVYKKEWDRTTRTYKEIYWKVVQQYNAFTPYLMNEEQLAELRLPPPSKLERSTNQPAPCTPTTREEFESPTAMVRSESDNFAEVYEAPTDMVRSESDCAEVFAPPQPMVRSDTDTIGGYAYIPPPPQLYRTSRSVEWFGEVSGN